MFSAETLEFLEAFATQSAVAVSNAQLFRELEQKSAELQVVSQHKSDFLASMSHELRTPLNAVIGFSEVLLERMFGDLNEQQDEYLRDILSSGRHLLALLNEILDLSKVEAGRMEIDVSTFSVSEAVEYAIALVRERAARHGITRVAARRTHRRSHRVGRTAVSPGPVESSQQRGQVHPGWRTGRGLDEIRRDGESRSPCATQVPGCRRRIVTGSSSRSNKDAGVRRARRGRAWG